MSSVLIPRLFNSILCPSRTISPSILRPYPRLPRTLQPAARRLAHTIPKPRSPAPPSTESKSSSSASPSKAKPRKLLEPHYELTFTCVPCSGRSTHTISKQGYHKGSVLITCPSCRNRHIISDHLNIFGNRKITVEDLMQEKGQLVKRGTLGEDGDVEFWEDGTVTERGENTAGGSSNSTGVNNEVDALSEEEDATRSREARDPSSQSAEPTNRTPTPLNNPGSRPSLDSTQHSHHVPSTRRQYSTDFGSSLDSDSSRPGPFGHPPLLGLPTSPLGRRGEVIQKHDPEGSLRQMLTERRSALHRLSKEEMLEYVRRLTAASRGIDPNLDPQAKQALVAEISSRLVNDVSDDFRDPMKYENPRAPQGRFSNGSIEILPRTRVANGEGSFQGAWYVPSRQEKSPPPLLRRWGKKSQPYRHQRRRETKATKAPGSFPGVRLYDYDTPDGRPRYIRAGPGYLKKQRRSTRREEEVSTPDQGAAPHDGTGPHTADEDPSRSLLAASEIRRDVRSSNSPRQGQSSETEQSARFRSDMERVALKRSKTTDAFVRVLV